MAERIRRAIGWSLHVATAKDRHVSAATAALTDMVDAYVDPAPAT